MSIKTTGRWTRWITFTICVAAVGLVAVPARAAIQIIPNVQIDLGGTSLVDNADKVTGVDQIDFVGRLRVILPDATPAVMEFATVQGIFIVNDFQGEGENPGGAALPLMEGGTNGGAFSANQWQLTGWFETRVKLTSVSGSLGGLDLKLEWEHDPGAATFLQINLDGESTAGSTDETPGNLGDASGINDGIQGLLFSDTKDLPVTVGNYNLASGSGVDTAIFEYDQDGSDVSNVFLNVSGDDITEPHPDGNAAHDILQATRTVGTLQDAFTPSPLFITNFNGIFGGGPPAAPHIYLSEDGNAKLIPEPTSLIVWSLLGVAGLFSTRRRRNSEV